MQDFRLKDKIRNTIIRLKKKEQKQNKKYPRVPDISVHHRNEIEMGWAHHQNEQQ